MTKFILSIITAMTIATGASAYESKLASNECLDRFALEILVKGKNSHDYARELLSINEPDLIWTVLDCYVEDGDLDRMNLTLAKAMVRALIFEAESLLKFEVIELPDYPDAASLIIHNRILEEKDKEEAAQQ